jgi:hypothetical protein
MPSRHPEKEPAGTIFYVEQAGRDGEPWDPQNRPGAGPKNAVGTRIQTRSKKQHTQKSSDAEKHTPKNDDAITQKPGVMGRTTRYSLANSPGLKDSRTGA